MKHLILLKIAVILLGLPVLVIGGIGGLWLFDHPVSPEYDQILYPIIIGIYLSCIPYFYALKQIYNLLGYIGLNKVFSTRTIKFLKNVKYCAFIISGIYSGILPFIYFLAEADDAPGLIIMGIIPIFASIVVAVFTAVLQELLMKAIALKEENELTI